MKRTSEPSKNRNRTNLKKDFSVKLPSSTPVASPRNASNSVASPDSLSKGVTPKLKGTKEPCPSSSRGTENGKSSASCPVPKPRKIVNATANSSVKDTETSVIDQESDLTNNATIPNDPSTIVDVRQPVVQEGSNLYLRFLYEEIHANKLEAPSFLRVPESSYSITLRHAADEFSNSSHRLRVRDHAESVQLENLSIEGFFELLDGLFKEGGITYERVLVLFFFCTDITVRALRDNLVTYFNDLVSWTLKFFTENIFLWVQQNGGWARVLEKSMDFTYKALLVTTLCFSTLALISYLRKK